MGGHKTRVYERRGQFTVTVPKAIALALDLKGAELVWEILGRDKLRITVQRGKPTRRKGR